MGASRETKTSGKHALQIFHAALRSADPVEAVLRHVRIEDDILIAGRKRYPLHRYTGIFVIGAGKASAPMAQAIERLLGKRITGGLINVKYGHSARLRRILLNECGHPLPDENGVRGARQIAAIASDAGANDLVIALISGGASALLPAPIEGLTLEQKQQLTRRLLDSGASIHEINTVRKHLSWIKGGQLARLAYPATVVALILSDVIGDNLDVIGSGPTVGDSSTSEDARAILRKYGIEVAATFVETPKPGDALFKSVQNVIVGSNRLAVDAAAAKARELGYKTLVLSTSMHGEAREVAQVHAAILREVTESGRPIRRPACILSGGETTVTLRGSGLGGRNQEFVLAAAIDIAGLQRAAVLSAGTDGTDGPTDAAGAICDGETIARGLAAGLRAGEYLANNDSYRYFERLDGLVKTGPTRTNVMDLTVLIAR